MRRPLLSLGLIAGLGSCYSSSSLAPRDGVICTALAVAAINVKVLDSATSVGLSFQNLWARAREGSYMDSSHVSFTIAGDAPKTFGLAYERAGVYDVAVKASGYREWTKSGVVVTHDECHVVPVLLTARLQR